MNNLVEREHLYRGVLLVDSEQEIVANHHELGYIVHNKESLHPIQTLLHSKTPQ